MNIGILSTSSIAPRFIAAVREEGSFQITALSSRSLEKAEEMAKAWNVPKAYGNHEELLEDKDVDTGKRQLKVLGKGNKERVVPFGTKLAEMIDDYRIKRDEEVEVSTTKFFVHTKGTSLNPMHIYNVVRKLMGAVTTQEKRSPHVLRHTFATSLLNDGADVNAIKELLGHETLAATQVYTHASFEKIKTIYERTHPRGKK